MKPIHCGKPARPWRKEWPTYWVEAYRCRVCGFIGLPTNQVFNQDHMNAMDALREAGIRFDAELEESHARRTQVNS